MNDGLAVRKWRGLLAAAAVAVATSANLGLATDAHALKQFGAKSYSKLGTATYYKVGGSSNFWKSTIHVPGPTVRQSRAYSGTQKVVVSAFMYMTNPTNWGELYNTWSHVDTRTVSGTIRPGYKRTFSSWDFDANPFSNYRVVMKVSYYTWDGRFLSSIYTDYNLTGDYQCNTDYCSVQAGRDGRASMLLMY